MNLFIERQMILIYIWDGNKIVSQIKKRRNVPQVWPYDDFSDNQKSSSLNHAL
jgi:hypothetical protein